jgi:hypothetical protein
MSSLSSNWNLTPERLLPDVLLRELSIEHIKFNAISHSLMHKALSRIASLGGLNMNLKMLKGFIESSNGI